MTTSTEDFIPARLWTGDLGVGKVEQEDVNVGLAVESDGPARIAIHTMIDGRGSMVSYYLDRESAISLARQILQSIELS